MLGDVWVERGAFCLIDFSLWLAAGTGSEGVGHRQERSFSPCTAFPGLTFSSASPKSSHPPRCFCCHVSFSSSTFFGAFFTQPTTGIKLLEKHFCCPLFTPIALEVKDYRRPGWKQKRSWETVLYRRSFWSHFPFDLPVWFNRCGTGTEGS